MNSVAGVDPYFPPAGVCISGAAGAIGSAVVRRFMREGWLVVAVDTAPAVMELGQGLGSLCEPVIADVLSTAGQQAVWGKIREIGGIDHVIAIAGGALEEELAVEDPADLTLETFEASVTANLASAWALVRSTLPGLRARATENRSVTLCSSRNAVAGHGLIAYSAAKAGLIGMMHPLAVQLGREGIRVNAVLPGQVMTPRAVALHDDPAHFERIASRSCSGRLATEDECADAFWALTQLSGVTGETLLVDHGAHIWREG